eukprot:Opistho-2@17276
MMGAGVNASSMWRALLLLYLTVTATVIAAENGDNTPTKTAIGIVPGPTPALPAPKVLRGASAPGGLNPDAQKASSLYSVSLISIKSEHSMESIASEHSVESIASK